MKVEFDLSKEHHVVGQIPPAGASLEDVQAAVEQFFYSVGCFWERLEGQGLITGNGHHMAQKLQAEAVKELLARWKGTT